MTFTSYLNYFKEIIDQQEPAAPYNDPIYIDFTKLNWSRTNRWLKQGKINEELSEVVKSFKNPQKWIVITEPWCGDAAHIVPFFDLLANLNPLISIDYELRDAAPLRIDQYLTNGSKSIPLLIIKDEKENDLLVWGPRPKSAQDFFEELKDKNTDFEESKAALQQWYNKDKGESLQLELLEAFKKWA